MKIAIIGGSGLEKLNIFKNATVHEIETPYGKPGSPPLEGSIGGVPVVFLSRHGKEHTIPPTHVNNRANIHALQKLGCTHIIATTACGSLREHIKRGDLVVLDQFIDFTRFRKNTFFDAFEPHTPVHTGMAKPFSELLRNIIIKEAATLNYRFHPSGTVITIEGPRFSTIAESNMFRLWGADVINMSTAPECMLANEAGIPYAAIALSTDYDCWKTDEEAVSWEAVLEVFQQNVQHVTQVLIQVIEKINI
ncbi:MAG TPA: S-methyl-5'-thioadenosine phosphorylase [Bacteroidales bacterium]|nr:S-methyl-5'-thioadenosine phosphorylase [Bacteroidales bacterium]HPS27504.1 S-methyl-5'-thioadenosine phosphorylase [Bacteroidales bacterium]